MTVFNYLCCKEGKTMRPLLCLILCLLSLLVTPQSVLSVSPLHNLCLLLLLQYLRLISKEYRSTVFKGLTDRFATRCKTAGWKLLEKSFSRLFLSPCLES